MVAGNNRWQNGSPGAPNGLPARSRPNVIVRPSGAGQTTCRSAQQHKSGALPRGEDAASRKSPLRCQNGYLRADSEVSTESLAMNAAPHQSEPRPPGLIAVTLFVPDAVWSLVKALQSPLFRSVS